MKIEDMTAKQIVAEAEEIVFKVGGWLEAANKLHLTREYVAKQIKTAPNEQRRIMLMQLRQLETRLL